jgi:hypothetical protein
LWKVEQLGSIAVGRTTYLDRIHPITRATYRYVRYQSHASVAYGELWKTFYPYGKSGFHWVLPSC